MTGIEGVEGLFNHWKKLLSAITMLSLLFSVGCSFIKPGENSIEGDIHILWDEDLSGLSADKYAIDALKEKYPKAEFKMHKYNVPLYGMTDTFPLKLYDFPQKEFVSDLIMFESTSAPFLLESGYLEPLDDYLAANPDLLTALSSGSVESLRSLSSDNHIYGLPLGRNVYGLYYNRAMFRDHQIPFPTDGMTWTEVLALADQFGDYISGNKDLSIDVSDYLLITSQLGVNITDPDTGHIQVDGPGFEKIFGFLEQLGNVKGNGNIANYLWAHYDRFGFNHMAMLAGRFMGSKYYYPDFQKFRDDEVDWDVVSFPTFEDQPDVGPAPAYYYLGIPKYSNRKGQAFDIISYLLSDEIQKKNSTLGLASALMDPKVNQYFGSDMKILLGKNTQAFFHLANEARADRDNDFNFRVIFSRIFRSYYWDKELFNEQHVLNKVYFQQQKEELTKLLELRRKEAMKKDRLGEDFLDK